MPDINEILSKTQGGNDSEAKENKPEKIAPKSDNQPSDIKTKAAEAKEYYDRLLRVAAEFDNYKKRIERETDEFKKYANESVLRDILPIIDNLERALTASTESDCKSLIAGIGLTIQQFNCCTQKFGVTQINAMGTPFDPCIHEAIMEEHSDEHPPRTVIRDACRVAYYCEGSPRSI